MDLVALEEIKQLKYRYLRCLDLKLWDEIGSCFTDDAVAAYSGGRYRFEGRDAIVGFLRQAMGAESFHSSHSVGHPEITLLEGGEARATWKLDDVVVDTRFGIEIRGAAFYEDEYTQAADGRWRIRRTGYKRIYEQMVSHSDTPSLKLTASFWSTGGRSELPAPGA